MKANEFNFDELDATTKKLVESTRFFIREYFFKRKAIQLGRAFKPADRFDKVEIWRRAAMNCIRLNAPPEDFVEAAFSLHGKIAGAPFTTHLSGPGIERLYKMHCLCVLPSDDDVKMMDNANEYDPYGATVEAARTVILEDVKILLKWLHSCTGKDRVDIETIKLIRSHMAPADAFTRILLGGNDELVMRQYYRSALDQMAKKPSLRPAAVALGFPMDAIDKFGKAVLASKIKSF